MDIGNTIFKLSKKELFDAINSSYSYSQVLNKLGIETTKHNQILLIEKIKEEHLMPTHFKNKIYGVIWDTEKEEFKKIVEESDSFSAALRKLNLQVTGGNLNTLKKRIEVDSLSVERIMKNNFNHDKTKMPLSEILIKNSPYKSSNSLKKRLIKEGILENKCAKCHVGPEWQGVPLSLELDHIDGDNSNNEIENLRILCPNCHSQTETFGGKNRKNNNNKKIHYCIDCNDVIFKGSKRCVGCSHAIRINKSNRPPKEVLIELILTKSFKEIDRTYNVSDNSVRKWCKHYKLPASKQGIIEWKTSNLIASS